MRVGGGDCLKYFKKGGTEKRGGETKILKRGKAGSRVGGCLKRGGLSPVTNYGFMNGCRHLLLLRFS